MLARMFRSVRSLILLGVASTVVAQGPDPESEITGLLRLQKDFEKLATDIYPCTATVTAYRRKIVPIMATAQPMDDVQARSAWVMDSFNNDYPGYEEIGIGSGFFLTESGEMLTCRHFLLKEDGELADLVSIETDDLRHTIATVIATEPTLNLALLRLEVFDEAYKPSFKVAEFGNSATGRSGSATRQVPSSSSRQLRCARCRAGTAIRKL